MKIYRVHTGEFITIKTGVLNSVRFIYSGMPDEKRFIISPVLNEAIFYQGSGFSPQVYYSIDTEIIRILDSKFNLVEANADYLRISIAE